jgi:hypothetical protein
MSCACAPGSVLWFSSKGLGISRTGFEARRSPRLIPTDVKTDSFRVFKPAYIFRVFKPAYI